MTDLLLEWHDFNVAIVGATAALGGLVIVASSVNIATIVKSRSLTARLGSGLVMLVVALVVSTVALMPPVDETWFGYVVVAVSAVAVAFQVAIARAVISDRDPRHRAVHAKALVGFLPACAYLAAGLLAVAGTTVALTVTAIAAILAIVAALVVSWIALVEVLR